MSKYELHRIEKNAFTRNESTGEEKTVSLGVESRHRTRVGAEKALLRLVRPRVERGTGERRWPLYDWDFEVRSAQ